MVGDYKEGTLKKEEPEVKDTKAKPIKSVKKSVTVKSKQEKADGGTGTEVNIPVSEKVISAITEEAITHFANDDGTIEMQEHFPKTMGNTDQNACRKNVPDVVVFGDDLFKLLSKASSEKEGWMKSTKAMDTGNGCVVQVTTQQRNSDGSYAVAEAVTFAQGTKIIENKDEVGNIVSRRLAGKR